MDITLLVAKVLGIYLIVAGLFLLFKGKTLSLILKDFFDHPSVIYLSGVILIFVSSMYLLQNNIWDGTWKTLITVFVWMILFKGLCYIFFPQMFNENMIQKFKNYFSVYGAVAFIIGLYLFFLN